MPIKENKPGTRLFQIKAPHFTAGIILEDGKTIKTAPIIRYMKGWSVPEVLHYCRKNAWTCIEVEME
jgi:hypothetical protein